MTKPGEPADPAWTQAERVARLFAADPAGTGVWLRARPGPQRERWLQLVADLMADGAPIRKVPLSITDDRLLGGLDLTATLASGRPVAERGLLAEANGGAVLIPGAERMPASLAARLAAVHDVGEIRLERDGLAQRTPARFGLILLDEGLDETERPPPVLLERIAFRLDLTGMRLADLPAQVGAGEAGPPRAKQRPSGGKDAMGEGVQAVHGHPKEGTGFAAGKAARSSEAAGTAVGTAASRLEGLARSPELKLTQPAAIAASNAAAEALCRAAAALGIGSARAPLLALRAARISAALDSRAALNESDLALAGQLVLAWRAQSLPEAESEQEEPDESDPADPPPDVSAEEEQADSGALADRVLEAARAALPRDLLERLQAERAFGAQSGGAGAGAQQKALRRGRRIGVMPGQPRTGARLDLVATLRAAAPWQRVRQGAAVYGAAAAQRVASPGRTGDSDVAGLMGREPAPQGSSGPERPPARIQIRPGDFRVLRLAERRETLTIFAVDASGSLALSRMAEAKGAVELLLADCYVRRDQVALIAFRGKRAELLLPPSRSLVRAKRSLASLPAGGGTPLASGIDAAAQLARSALQRGQTPLIVLLTDGRANIARDGEPRRTAAQADALTSATLVRASHIRSLLIDTAPRPEPRAGELAAAMGALYLPMPQASAGALSSAVKGARAFAGAGRHG